MKNNASIRQLTQQLEDERAARLFAEGERDAAKSDAEDTREHLRFERLHSKETAGRALT